MRGNGVNSLWAKQRPGRVSAGCSRAGWRIGGEQREDVVVFAGHAVGQVEQPSEARAHHGPRAGARRPVPDDSLPGVG